MLLDSNLIAVKNLKTHVLHKLKKIMQNYQKERGHRSKYNKRESKNNKHE